nr:portal protein [Sphingomonas sp. R-74633]
MEGERMLYEPLWRELDERVDPQAAGGFDKRTPGGDRGNGNFDATATTGLDNYTAAIAGLTIPTGQTWASLTTPDKDLNKLPEVQRWLEHANDRLFACRYAPGAGFEVQATADIRQGGKYGTAPLWVDEVVGRGLFYRSIHMSEAWIDLDFTGRVDTFHRKYELTARQAAQKFGRDALSDKMLCCLTDDNPAKQYEKFEFLHAVRPNGDYEYGAPAHLGMPDMGWTIAVDEKALIRKLGYHSFPVPTSRTIVTPGATYGRSPAMKVIGTIRVLQEIAKTMLRAAHKSVDPALAFFDDGNISRLATKPGGFNPNLVDEMGNLLVHAIPGGGDLSWGLKVQEEERQVVRDAFLERIFQLLFDPTDRMTATEVLERAQKEGLLVGPYRATQETEKLAPMTTRELDILMRARQIDPMPPVMREAGVRQPVAEYQNGLARMARAEEASGFMRLVEITAQVSGFDPGAADHINFDRAVPGVAEVLSVRPSWLNSPDEVAAKRQQREQAQAMQSLTESAPAMAGAALDLAKANDVAAAA